MTHYTQLTEMLKQANVKYIVHENLDLFRWLGPTVQEGAFYVTVESSKELGYSGFTSEWVFSRDGQLLLVGHYE
jgi:hypothetical protein